MNLNKENKEGIWESVERGKRREKRRNDINLQTK